VWFEKRGSSKISLVNKRINNKREKKAKTLFSSLQNKTNTFTQKKKNEKIKGDLLEGNPV